jgi:hypothetical protein
MDPKLFISYRRAESAHAARLVSEQLAREFGRDNLFIDVGGSIPLGSNFTKVIGEKLSKCAALLAIIGPNWLEALDKGGNRRLRNPDDIVRIEIGTALKRGIPVIPILLDGANVPNADQLPDDLKELSQRNGLEVRHASFDEDMAKLIRGLAEGGIVKETKAATKKTSSGWSELFSGILNALAEGQKQRTVGAVSPAETPGGFSLAQTIPGLWQLQIMYPNGTVGHAIAHFESSGNFRAEGQGLAAFTISGIWRVDSSNQLSLQGHQSDGRQTLPYHAVIGFSDVNKNAMMGSLNTGERTVWQRKR